MDFQSQNNPTYNLRFLAKSPVLYHCHHFNLFLEQTIDDALGEEDASKMRRKCAHGASYEFLRDLCVEYELVTAIERLEMAKEVFSAMGQGTLRFEVDEKGGKAFGNTLHYGHSWAQKYGQKVKRRNTADDFACGFSAAATEIAYDLIPGSLTAEEHKCIALRDAQCEINIILGDGKLLTRTPVSEAEITTILPPALTGKNEELIGSIVEGLNGFLAGVKGDERGLVEAFGVYVTLHLAGYYNRISYDTYEVIHKTKPDFADLVRDLFRESGHVCVFNTFGGILASPEWEGMVGPISGEPELIILYCLAIARALGFGQWVLDEFVAGERLVVSAPMTYESAYYKIRQEKMEQKPEFFFQGAVSAIMQLATNVSWEIKPVFNTELYAKLFQRGEIWNIEQTTSSALGDQKCQIVLTKK